MPERLNQAMEHIERQLDGSIDVGELAGVAATSQYHLRRMFSALAWIVRFESINYRAKVWLNGQPLGTHRGAYLPFEFRLPASTLKRDGVFYASYKIGQGDGGRDSLGRYYNYPSPEWLQSAYAASGAWHQLKSDTSETKSFDEAPATMLHVVVKKV